MPEIKRISCPLGQYTLLSDGYQNVTFFIPSTKGGRMAFGDSTPSAETADYKAFNHGGDVELGSLGGAKVWWMPNDGSQVVEVIRG